MPGRRVLFIKSTRRLGNGCSSKLPRFVETSLVPYIGSLLALASFSNDNAELGALFFTIAATITVKFLADITVKVTELFSGIQIQIQIQSPIAVSHIDEQAQPAPALQEATQSNPNIKLEVTQ